ncbi:MAG TPA: hypothetical protein VMX38_13080 [Verrucomicrobiae bacterium]|nr:hypothetical protein [Verrucomicrobiae bacterium]
MAGLNAGLEAAFTRTLCLLMGSKELFSPLPCAQSPERWQPHVMMGNDLHRFQRIGKSRSAFTAHLVATAINRENTAQFSVTATEGYLQRVRHWMRNAIPDWSSLNTLHIRSPSKFLLIFSSRMANGGEPIHGQL